MSRCVSSCVRDNILTTTAVQTSCLVPTNMVGAALEPRNKFTHVNRAHTRLLAQNPQCKSYPSQANRQRQACAACLYNSINMSTHLVTLGHKVSLDVLSVSTHSSLVQHKQHTNAAVLCTTLSTHPTQPALPISYQQYASMPHGQCPSCHWVRSVYNAGITSHSVVSAQSSDVRARPRCPPQHRRTDTRSR